MEEAGAYREEVELGPVYSCPEPTQQKQENYSLDCLLYTHTVNKERTIKSYIKKRKEIFQCFSA